MIYTLSGSRICRLMCMSRGWLSICNSATFLLILWGGFWLDVDVMGKGKGKGGGGGGCGDAWDAWDGGG